MTRMLDGDREILSEELIKDTAAVAYAAGADTVRHIRLPLLNQRPWADITFRQCLRWPRSYWP